MRQHWEYIIILLFVLAGFPAGARADAAPTVPCVILAAHPHDPSTSTQGLVFANGRLFESSGGWDKSSVMRVDPDTGKIFLRVLLPGSLFAEGLAPGPRGLHLLTWKSGITYLLDPDTLMPTDMARCLDAQGRPDEGWGLAWDNRRLYRSNGTEVVSIHDPRTFARTGGFAVTDQGRPVVRLNELEWVRGLLLANVWKEDRVAVIDPTTGKMLLWLDLTPLRAKVRPDAGTANGIAWDETHARLLVTGKLWDKVFEIDPAEILKLCPAGAPEQP